MIGAATGVEGKMDIVFAIAAGFEQVEARGNRWGIETAAAASAHKAEAGDTEIGIQIKVEFGDSFAARQVEIGNRQADSAGGNVAENGIDPGKVSRNGRGPAKEV